MSRARELELRLQSLEHQLRLLQRITRFMVRDVSLPEVLNEVVQLVVEFMECDSCLLYLIEGGELVLCASNVPHPASIGKLRLKLDEGLTGWVARERRLLAISREAYHDPRFKLFSDLPEDTFEAFLSAPIVNRGVVAGVIDVLYRAAHSRAGSEVELLSVVGELVACPVELSCGTAGWMVYVE